MKLEVGKFYKTRDGRKAEVVYINRGLRLDYPAVVLIEGLNMPTNMTIGGSFLPESMHPRDLVSEWKEPVRVTGWYNVYADLLGGPYETKVHAINTQCETCIGQIYIDQEVET